MRISLFFSTIGFTSLLIAAVVGHQAPMTQPPPTPAPATQPRPATPAAWRLWLAQKMADARRACAQYRPNRPPVLSSTAAIIYTGQRATMPLRFTDPDGDAVSVERVDAASAGGRVELVGAGQVAYTPPAGWLGTTAIPMVLCDARGARTTATLRVEVTYLGGPTDLVSYCNASGLTGAGASRTGITPDRHGTISDDGRFALVQSENALLGETAGFVGLRDRLTGALIPVPAGAQRMQLSGDGARVVFIHDVDGVPSLGVMDRASGATLSTEPLPSGDHSRWSLSQRGDYAAFYSWDTGMVSRWHQGAGFDQQFAVEGLVIATPEISDDGRRIALTHAVPIPPASPDEPYGEASAITVWTQGHGVTRLIRPDILYWSDIGLSGDGTLAAIPDGNRRILLLNLDTQAERWVAGGQAAVTLARDGSWLASTQRIFDGGPSRYVVMRTDLGTDETIDLATVQGDGFYSVNHALARGAPYLLINDGATRSPRDTNAPTDDVYVLGVPGWLPTMPHGVN